MAARNGHTECVDLLHPVSDPVVALQQLQQQHPDNYNLWGQLQQMVGAEIATAPGVKIQREM